MSQWNDWFEITTYPNDPSRIEMRRLPPEEAIAAYNDQLREQFEYLAAYFSAPLNHEEITAMIEEHEKSFEPEPQTEEVNHREQIKATLREKRLELLVKTTPAYARVPQPVFRMKRCRPKGNR